MEESPPAWVLFPGRAAGAIAASLSGNFNADGSRIKFLVQVALRAVLCSVFPVELLYQEATGTGDRMQDPAGVVARIFTLLSVLPTAWIIIVAGVRSHDVAVQSLLAVSLRKGCTIPNAKANTDTFCRGCVMFGLVIVLILVNISGAVRRARIGYIGLWWASVRAFPNIVLAMGMCDLLVKVGQWVRASRCAIEHFGDSVAGSLSSQRGLTSSRRWSRRLSTRQTSVLNVWPECSEEPDAGGTGIKDGPDDQGQPESLTLASFEFAYEEAACVVCTTNDMLSGPVTMSLICVTSKCCSTIAALARDPNAKAKDENQPSDRDLVLDTCVFGCLAIFALAWLASIGDAHIKVTRVLLSPHCFLRLATMLDATGDMSGLIHSLSGVVLGFEVYNVTMTSQKVLYVVGTIILGLILTATPMLYADMDSGEL